MTVLEEAPNQGIVTVVAVVGEGEDRSHLSYSSTHDLPARVRQSAIVSGDGGQRKAVVDSAAASPPGPRSSRRMHWHLRRPWGEKARKSLGSGVETDAVVNLTFRGLQVSDSKAHSAASGQPVAVPRGC